MSRDRLWIALVLLLPVLGATIAPLSTVDLAYQVRVGDLIRASGSILRADPLTFTGAGLPWLNQQWGTSVLLSLGWSIGGWAGLALLRSALVGLAVAVLFWTVRRWLPARPAAVLCLLAFVVGIGALALRAQLFGIVCFALVLALLVERRRRPRLAILVPVIVLAWANLHGSFFLGVGAAALALLADLRGPAPAARRSAVVLALSAVASCVTPFGPEVWSYAIGLSTNGQIARLVTEWQRTNPLTFDGALFYATVALALGSLVVARRRDGRWPPFPAMLWLGGLVLVGAWAERGVVWFAFGAPIVVAPVLARLARRRAAIPGTAAPSEPALFRRLNLGIAVALGLLVVALQPLWRPAPTIAGPDGLLADAPVGLARALAARGSATDRAVVPQRWGSWLEWAAPGVPVMVDSRIELIPAAAWSDYVLIADGGPASLATLRTVGASIVVVDRATQAALLASISAAGSGWSIAYQDDRGVLAVPGGG